MSTTQGSNLIDIANDLIGEACRLDGRGRSGGVLCVRDLRGILYIRTVGHIPDPEREAQYKEACVEKANRTIFYLHVSSWITRDLDTKKRGGGILTERLFAVSLSGLSEHLDEAFSSVVAMNGGLGMTEDRWCHIRHISENPHMARFGYLS